MAWGSFQRLHDPIAANVHLPTADRFLHVVTWLRDFDGMCLTSRRPPTALINLGHCTTVYFGSWTIGREANAMTWKIPCDSGRGGEEVDWQIKQQPRQCEACEEKLDCSDPHRASFASSVFFPF